MPNPAPADVVHAYTVFLGRAILALRFRLRNGGAVSPDELHDFLDALHNVPTMMREHGGWFIEANIDAALEDYDARWTDRPDGERRVSLIRLLARSKQGEFDALK